MSNNPFADAFGPAHAEIYDRQFEPIAAIKDGLLLLVQAHFALLPADARILVAGAGTGAEARHLARAFPGWRFTLVDPSAAMLAVGRRHAITEGLDDRFVYHEGFVSSLGEGGFDAATSVLVSHFLTNTAGRLAYFADIAERLLPGGLLFNADLCADPTHPSFEPAMELWLRLLHRAVGMTDEKRTSYRAMFGRDFAVQGPTEVESLIEQAGFTAPALCYQAALLRGWVASRQ